MHFAAVAVELGAFYVIILALAALTIYALPIWR